MYKKRTSMATRSNFAALSAAAVLGLFRALSACAGQSSLREAWTDAGPIAGGDWANFRFVGVLPRRG
jgi:hypothetical protein